MFGKSLDNGARQYPPEVSSCPFWVRHPGEKSPRTMKHGICRLATVSTRRSRMGWVIELVLWRDEMAKGYVAPSTELSQSEEQ